MLPEPCLLDARELERDPNACIFPQKKILLIDDLSVTISPPSALDRRQQGGMDWLSRPLVFYPTNDNLISDAQDH